MSTTNLDTDGNAVDQENADPSKTLQLEMKIDAPSACERHVVVTVPRSEINRYFREAFDTVTPKAELPGFRQGKAPRSLIESRFKSQVTEQVKSSLIMDSLQKITDGGHFSAISEPEFDYKVIEIPEEGDFRYEFRIEVRPDFETPQWSGLKLNRPTISLTEEDIDRHLSRTLARFVSGEPVDGAAKIGDVITFNATFTIAGEKVNELEEGTVTLRNSLSFGDAIVSNFGELMVGAKEGEKRVASAVISNAAANENRRGSTVDIEVEVVEIRRIDVEDISDKKLDELGFSSHTELRDFVRTELERQFEYHQQQALRKQIVEILTRDANWEMPESLVRRQTNREVQRMVLELQRSGFSADQIRNYVNVSKNNARETTVSALREHFILEKIAEDLKIEPSPEAYDREVELIAEQNDIPARKIRARLEKTGQMDAVRNQIVEREVIARIAQEAELTNVPDTTFLKQDPAESSIDFTITGEAAEIPEAKHDNDPVAHPGAPKLPESEKS